MLRAGLEIDSPRPSFKGQTRLETPSIPIASCMLAASALIVDLKFTFLCVFVPCPPSLLLLLITSCNPISEVENAQHTSMKRFLLLFLSLVRDRPVRAVGAETPSWPSDICVFLYPAPSSSFWFHHDLEVSQASLQTQKCLILSGPQLSSPNQFVLLPILLNTFLFSSMTPL